MYSQYYNNNSSLNKRVNFQEKALWTAYFQLQFSILQNETYKNVFL